MKITASGVMLAILALPTLAGVPACGVAEDNNASAPVKPDSGTAEVLTRLTERGTLNAAAAADELNRAEVVRDNLIGHVRWAIRQGGPNKTSLYHLLLLLRVGGRADVADQFLEGLHDADPDVRIASADGLQWAPSGKRAEAASALVDRLKPTAGEELEHHTVLNSLRRIGSPENLKQKSGELVGELKSAGSKNIADDLFVEWKAKSARVLLNVLGPEATIGIFRQLDPGVPAELSATAGAVQALAEYTGEEMSDMTAAERNQLRDLIIPFAVGLLKRAQSKDAAVRDAQVREGTLMLIPVVLRGERRPSDVKAISDALDVALRIEPKETSVAALISDVQQILKR